MFKSKHTPTRASSFFPHDSVVVRHWFLVYGKTKLRERWRSVGKPLPVMHSLPVLLEVYFWRRVSFLENSLWSQSSCWFTVTAQHANVGTSQGCVIILYLYPEYVCCHLCLYIYIAVFITLLKRRKKYNFIFDALKKRENKLLHIEQQNKKIICRSGHHIEFRMLRCFVNLSHWQ